MPELKTKSLAGIKQSDFSELFATESFITSEESIQLQGPVKNISLNEIILKIK